MMIEIRHLEWITVTADGRKVLGYNQEWYPEKRQKLAGCGPTVGAMIAAYVEMKEWQMPVTTKEGATSGSTQLPACTACTRQDGSRKAWKHT